MPDMVKRYMCVGLQVKSGAGYYIGQILRDGCVVVTGGLP